jgi:hypothetical protein
MSLLTATTISANGAGDVVAGLARYAGLDVQLTASAAPTGGSPTLDVYLQKTLDGGTTWQDIAAYRFTAAAKRFLRISQIAAGPTATVAPADGSLTNDTVAQGPFGDQLRVKYVFALGGGTGTFTLAVTAFPIAGP